MNDQVLQDARTLLVSMSSFEVLLTATDKRLQELSTAQSEGANLDVPSQRVLARDAVQAIIEPHVVEWMDDDDSLTDAEFITRALAEVDSRFERQ